MSLDLENTKICKICDTIKPLTEFRKNGPSYRARCRKCEKEARAEKKNKVSEATEEKVPGITQLNKKIKVLHTLFLEANRKYQSALAERKQLIDMYEYQKTPAVQAVGPPEEVKLNPTPETKEPAPAMDELEKMMLDADPEVAVGMMLQKAARQKELKKHEQAGENEYSLFKKKRAMGIPMNEIVCGAT